MPSAKGDGNGIYSTTLRQARTQPMSNSPTPDLQDNADIFESSMPDLTATAKNPPLKLPQLRANDTVDTTTPAANENNTLMLLQSWQRGKNALAHSSKSHLPAIIMFCGTTLSAMWLAAAAVYVHNAVGWQNIKTLMPHEIGGFLAGLLAPVALFWMVLTFWMRSVDVKLYAEALRDEIQRMIFPSEEAERRVNNDIDRLVKQTAEMSRATRIALGTLQQARQAVQGETMALEKNVSDAATRLEHLEERLGHRNQSLQDLHGQMDAKSQSFATTGEQLLKDATALDAIITQTHSKTAQIGETLQAPIAQLQHWQNDIVDALNAGLAHLSDKQNLLRADANDIEAKALLLADTLHTSTGKLYDFTDDALDKAKLIETRLQGQGISLQDTLEQIAAQTESLTAQRDALLVTLQRSTEQGHADLTAHVALLDETVAQLHDTRNTVADSMQKMLHEAGDSWTIQADRFNATIQAGTAKTTEQLTSSQTELQAGYTMLQRDVDYLTQAVQNLLEKAGETWQSQAVDFNATVHKDIQRNVDTLTKTQMDLQQSYTLFQFDVENATQKTGDLLTGIQENLQAVAETITSSVTQQHAQTAEFVDTLLAKHQSQTRTATADLSRLQQDLNAMAAQLSERGQILGLTGEQTASVMQSLYVALEEGMDKIAHTTILLQQGLSDAQNAFTQPVQKLEDATQHAHDKAQMIGNMLDQRVANLYELGGALTHQATMLGSDLVTKSQILENVLVRLQGDAKTLNADILVQTEKLDDQVRVTFDQVNSLLPQIQDIQQNFAQTSMHAEKAQVTLTQLNDAAITGGQNMLALSDDVVSRVAQSLTSYQELPKQIPHAAQCGFATA